MIEFSPGQTAKVATQALKSALETRAKAQHCAVLWFAEIFDQKLFRDLGYSSINQFAKQELGFSKSHTGEFLQLCHTFKRLPKVKEKVKSGELCYSSARVLARVADEKNQDGWLDFALKNSRRELEQEVKLAKQEASEQAVGQAVLIPVPNNSRPTAVVPVNENLVMSPAQFARYEKLWEQVRKHRSASPDKIEALLEIMESYVADHNGESRCEDQKHGGKKSARADLLIGRKPPVQIHVHQCPDCQKASVQTSKGELEIGGAELERALCDCMISRPHERNKTSIPPAIRRLVLARARSKCQRPGCDQTRFLEIHHIIPRSRGGTNDPDNCICLCGSCHKLLHDRQLLSGPLFVKAPQTIYEWKTGQVFLPTETHYYSRGGMHVKVGCSRPIYRRTK